MNTSHKFEKFVCNVNDGIGASLMATRVHNWMNNKSLNKEMATRELSITIVGTFDNNRMYICSDKEQISGMDFAVVKQLFKVYFEILLPFMPKMKMSEKDKDF